MFPVLTGEPPFRTAANHRTNAGELTAALKGSHVNRVIKKQTAQQTYVRSSYPFNEIGNLTIADNDYLNTYIENLL